MGLEYISQPQVFMAPITALGGIEGFVNVTLDSTSLTANAISADFVDFGNLIADNAEITNLNVTSIATVNVISDDVETNYLKAYNYFLIPSTLVLEVTGEVLSLPNNTQDIELSANSTFTINNFINGSKGVVYTVTNKSTNTITISSSPTVYVRNGTSWRSNTSSLSSSFLELKQNNTCQLRADTSFVSVW